MTAGTQIVVQPGSRAFFSGNSRLCRRYIFSVQLESLLGLVFVEFASERLGDGWPREKAQDTDRVVVVI